MVNHRKQLTRTKIAFVILPIALFVIATVGAFMSPNTLTPFRGDDAIDVFHTRAAWVSEPGLPFSDVHPQEYPPGAVLFLALPRLLSDDIGVYHAGFSVLMIIVFAALLITTAKSLVERNRNPALTLFFLLPGFLFFSIWRFDTLPALFVALGTLMVIRGRWGAAILSLSLGAIAKGYPAIFLIPLFMLIGNGRMTADALKEMIRGVRIATVIGVLLIAGALLIGIFPDLVSPVLFHIQREFEIGALGSAVFWPETTTAMQTTTAYKFISLAFPAIQLTTVLFVIMRGRLTNGTSFIRMCILLILPFLLFSRFSSPQWIIWLTPLLILVGNPFELAILALLDITIYTQFPLLFSINPFGGVHAAAVLLKSTLMLILLFTTFKELIRTKSLILRTMKKTKTMESRRLI